MVIVAYAGPESPAYSGPESPAVEAHAILLNLPTDIHSLFVNKPFSF